MRLEIFSPGDDAERYAQAIVTAGAAGEPGDGMVAITPVETVLHIRGGMPQPPVRVQDASRA